jgi:ribosomal protein S27AE
MFRFVKVVGMAEVNLMICPDCGVPMNHHADKLRKETHSDDASAFDSTLGGVIEEFHTCPQCGKTESRRASRSETS